MPSGPMSDGRHHRRKCQLPQPAAKSLLTQAHTEAAKSWHKACTIMA
jgi:hypothetical protein